MLTCGCQTFLRRGEQRLISTGMVGTSFSEFNQGGTNPVVACGVHISVCQRGDPDRLQRLRQLSLEGSGRLCQCLQLLKLISDGNLKMRPGACGLNCVMVAVVVRRGELTSLGPHIASALTVARRRFKWSEWLSTNFHGSGFWADLRLYLYRSLSTCRRRPCRAIAPFTTSGNSVGRKRNPRRGTDRATKRSTPLRRSTNQGTFLRRN
mmetsp:Transcript_34538/g.75619  ORF Transcript_34538/g.75619 Transcript_34538/m.75619 type:complete len:208 (-) Transcript_34538:625-1248(-)